MKIFTAITRLKMFIIINLIIGLIQLQFASINAYAVDPEADETGETVTSESEEEMREQIEENYQECLKSDTWDRDCRKNRRRMYNELEESSQSGISTSDEADASAKADSINDRFSSSIAASILHLLVLTIISILTTTAGLICLVVPSLWIVSAGAIYLLVTEAWNISKYQKDVKKRNFEYETNVDEEKNQTQAASVESVIDSYEDRLRAVNTKLSNTKITNIFFLTSFIISLVETALCAFAQASWFFTALAETPFCKCHQYYFVNSTPSIDGQNSWDLSSLEYNRIASGEISSTSINRYLELPIDHYQQNKAQQKNYNVSRIKQILSALLPFPHNAYAKTQEEIEAAAKAKASSNNEEFNEEDDQEVGSGDWWASVGITTAALALIGIAAAFLVPAVTALDFMLKPAAYYWTRPLVTGAIWAYGEVVQSVIEDNKADIEEMKGKYEILLETINSQNKEVSVSLMKLEEDTTHSTDINDSDTSSVAVDSSQVLNGTEESMVSQQVKDNEFKKSNVSDPFQKTDFDNIANVAGNLTQSVQDTLDQNNTGPSQAAANDVDSSALKKLGKDLKNQINSELKKSGKPEVDFEGETKKMQDDMKAAIVKTLNGLSKDEFNGLMSSFGGGLSSGTSAKEEEGEKEDDFDAKRLAARNKKPEDDKKKDESIKGLDMNLDFGKKVKKTQGNLKSGKELSKYKSNIKDITKNDKVSIFKILTIRYIKSAFPVFLRKKKPKNK